MHAAGETHLAPSPDRRAVLVRTAGLPLGPDPLALLHAHGHPQATLRGPLRRGPYRTDWERRAAATGALPGCRQRGGGGSGCGARSPRGEELAVSLADDRGLRRRQPLCVKGLRVGMYEMEGLGVVLLYLQKRMGVALLESVHLIPVHTLLGER